jgi:hypothetical protein
MIKWDRANTGCGRCNLYSKRAYNNLIKLLEQSNFIS